MIRALLLSAALSMLATPSIGHEIYSSVSGKDGSPCCNGHDCSATVYREKGGTFEFLTRENHWVVIPEDRIIFLPIPGDELAASPHRAHLCYRAPSRYSSPEHVMSAADGSQSIYLYCAFIPPDGS
jgi:hypothetical protein